LKIAGFIISVWPTVIAIFKLLGVVFAAITSPIGIVIALLVGAVALIIAYWTPIKEFFIELWESVVEIFNTAKENLVAILTSMYDWMNEKTNGAFAIYVEVIQTYLMTAWEIVKAIWEYIK